MADYPSLPLWTDAYLSDTTDLTAEEHGAYLLLLMAAWRAPDCSLVDDDARLARIAAMGLKRWRKIRPVIERFWCIADGRWTQKRLLKERARVNRVREQKRHAARARHQPRDAEKEENRFPVASTGNNENSTHERQVGQHKPLKNNKTTPAAASEPHMRNACNPYPYPEERITTATALKTAARARPDKPPDPVAAAPVDRQVFLDTGDRVLDAMGVADDPRWCGNYSIVQSWLAGGADPNIHILPTVTRLMAGRGDKGPPRSLGYFTTAIAEAVAAGNAPLPETRRRSGEAVPFQPPDLDPETEARLEATRRRYAAK